MESAARPTYPGTHRSSRLLAGYAYKYSCSLRLLSMFTWWLGKVSHHLVVAAYHLVLRRRAPQQKAPAYRYKIQVPESTALIPAPSALRGEERRLFGFFILKTADSVKSGNF